MVHQRAKHLAEEMLREDRIDPSSRCPVHGTLCVTYFCASYWHVLVWNVRHENCKTYMKVLSYQKEQGGGENHSDDAANDLLFLARAQTPRDRR